MTAPHPDQQQLWLELHGTMIKPLLTIAANPHEEPAKRTLALQIAHEASPNVTIKALAALAASLGEALSHETGQPPTFFLEKWARSSGR